MCLFEHCKPKCQKPGRSVCFLEHRKSAISENDRFYKLFGTPQIKNARKRKVLYAFWNIANQKYQKTTGFASLLEHGKPKMLENNRFSNPFRTSRIKHVRKTPSSISFLERRQSKMPKNVRFYTLSGTSPTENAQKRQVL